MQRFNNDSARLSINPIIRTIPEIKFYSLVAANSIIVNPDCGDRYPIQMFLELPAETADKYWIKVEAQATVKFITRFAPLAK